MPLTIKGRRVSKDYLIEHGIINDYFSPIKKEDDSISRQAAIDVVNNNMVAIEMVKRLIVGDLKRLPSAQSTLYGYNIEHLELIAKILQKENLPPERVVEALTDINRIVDIVRDEFEETLRKAVEQCKI